MVTHILFVSLMVMIMLRMVLLVSPSCPVGGGGSISPRGSISESANARGGLGVVSRGGGECYRIGNENKVKLDTGKIRQFQKNRP